MSPPRPPGSAGTPPRPAAPGAPPVPGTPTPPAGARPPARPPGTPQPSPQGEAGTPKVSFHLKYIEQEERKTLTFEYHSSEATQRTYAPQAFFGLLAEDLDRDDYFLEVDLDDPFFRTFKVDVDLPVDFATIGLHSATVALDYGDPADPESHKHEDLVFNATTPGPQVFEVFVNDRYDLAYKHRVELNFDPDSGWDGEHNSYALPEETTEDRTLLVDPHASLGFIEVDVFPHRLDAGVISWTDVTFSYEDPSGWKAERTLTVNPGGEHQAWRVRTSSPEHKTYTYRRVHHLKDGTTREIEPVTSRASSLPIDDPFPASIDPRFVFQFPPADFQRVLIDLTYEDTDNSYNREEQLELVGADIQPTAMHIATLDPKKRAFRYRVTLVGQDGSIVRGPELESELELVGVGPTGEQI